MPSAKYAGFDHEQKKPAGKIPMFAMKRDASTRDQHYHARKEIHVAPQPDGCSSVRL